MIFTEWIGRMVEALSSNDDHVVQAKLYKIKKELDSEEAEEMQHWSDL
jgi:hypothetical protein